MIKKMIILCFQPILFLWGQETTPFQPEDTSLYLVQLYSPELTLGRSLSLQPLTFELSQSPSKYFYPTSLASQPPLIWTLQDNSIDITLPWKLELAHENENKTLNAIFSSVGTGSALYLAYRHVKKYGFW